MSLIVRAVTIAAFASASIALAAPVSAQDTATKARKALDPNEVVCTSEPDLGSRLVRHKTCMTRAQWAERARNDRQTVDRSQSSSCVRQGGC